MIFFYSNYYNIYKNDFLFLNMFFHLFYSMKFLWITQHGRSPSFISPLISSGWAVLLNSS